ncbi:ATP-dependent DNA ligase [Belliella aquatica]|uniref:DNA ligase (ATP) n=1 Tax=Belliella aquatica TaxID=1323734 RepID=A0ABQ1MYC6_9BACT|nr:ATP-dependent DNA ligase [Belliella aquatica]MCH7406691.1 ATP-dependent DNA ligase [Belliella aquatica]GGC47304.1 ATP-dependent DNA ligase [Belliella aquatica]
MKLFTELFSSLDQSNKTSDKLRALELYFRKTSDKDKLWTLALFTHKKPKRAVTTKELRTWCIEIAQIPEWLFEESYQTVGDLAETIALLLPHPDTKSDFSLAYWIEFLKDLKEQPEDEKKSNLLAAWSTLDKQERFVFNKIITGGFRVGVSQNLITQAIANVFEMEKTEVAHRLMGNWTPENTSFDKLILAKNFADDLSRPYPFYLAYPLEEGLESLGEIEDWQIEWKWDGIRGQIIQRAKEVFIWSRGEELVTEKFPELVEFSSKLPDGTVLDGEIIAFQDGSPLPFSLLQTRIGRKTVSKKLLLDAPVGFICYDVLEFEGRDLRDQSMLERRKILEQIDKGIAATNFQISPFVEVQNWKEAAILQKTSRSMLAEGFMLKKKTSSYEVGRKRGNWWKWKIEPLTIDGVVLYAQKGHGRRANLYSDYTLAVWEDEKLIPFAKAYSGLTDAEMKEVDQYVKKNTLERFGPVRTVKPGLVFEIAFEGIQESPRHKSGIALRFPRIQRWRKDKPIEEANTLNDLKALLSVYGG